MYRDVIKVAKSLYRSAYPVPSVWLAYKLGRLTGKLSDLTISSMGYSGRDYCHRFRDDMELGVLITCLLTRTYLDLRAAGTEIAAIRFEDLVADPTESIRRILEFCRLPEELTKHAVRGMEVDSQRNSIIAKSIIGHLPEPELTPEAEARANEWLRKYGLPLVGEEYLIDGTITAKNR